MKNKKILIVVTGSIASYKACEVIRMLRKEGAEVQVMMTNSAQEFIGKTTFTALTNNAVITDMFNNTSKASLIWRKSLEDFLLISILIFLLLIAFLIRDGNK